VPEAPTWARTRSARRSAVAPTGVVRCPLLSESAPLNYYEAPVSLNGGRFDLSILMTGNHDEATRRCAHCLVFLQVEPDSLGTRLVSTFAEELALLTRPEQRRGHLTHTFIDFSKEDLVAALLLLQVEIQRLP
jgi:hypothetical protein